MAITGQPIAFRISGTKARQAGFAPLLNMGVLPANEGDDMDKTTLIAEKPVYIIKHTKDYILYSIIDRRVKSYDADASGVLSIAMTIKKGYKLSGGASPYTLLKQAYELFISTYMVRKADGRDEFINKDVDDTAFRDLFSKYPTEEDNRTLLPMNPKGLTATLRVEESNREVFFRDTQYREFMPFKEVEIGYECQTTEPLKNLRIPRPNIYSLYVNGVSTNKNYTEDDGVISASAPSTETHDYVSVNFSIQELLMAEESKIEKDGATIQLDNESNRIKCELKCKEKEYAIKYEFNGKNAKDFIVDKLGNGRIQLFLGDKDISKAYYVPVSFVDKDIRFEPNEIEGMVLSVKKKVSKTEKNLTLTCSIAKKELNITDEKTTIGGGVHAIPQGGKSSSFYDDINGKIALQKKWEKEKEDLEKDYERRIETCNRNHEEECEKLKKSRIVFCVIALFVGVGLGIGGTVVYNNMNSSDRNAAPSDTIDAALDSTDVAPQDTSTAVLPPDVETPTTENPEKEQDASAQDSGTGTNANPTKSTEQRREEVIQFACQRNLRECERHEGWKKDFNQEERVMISAVINPNQYYKDLNATGKRCLEETKSKPLTSWDDITTVYKEILKITTDKAYKNNNP